MRSAAALQTGMEPFPGCRLHRPLGSGGFAEVWEAEVDDCVIALKFLPCTNSTSTPRELRTIQAVRELHHPNLIRVHRVWCQPGYVVVAMEKADASLLDLLDVYRTELDTNVSGEHAVFLLSQVAQALDFLNNTRHRIHGQSWSIQHCDVKPSNILLFGETVKLTDFGLATLMSGPSCARSGGTVAYSAPEMFQGRVSNRTDQYALALTYCQLRGGRLPFADIPETYDRKYLHPPPDLTMLPEKERPIVARALSVAPHSRWPACEEFIDRLAQVMI